MPDTLTLRPKALAVFREGRMRILECVSDHELRVTKVLARVESSRDGGEVYAVDFDSDGWRCTCRDGRWGDTCRHIMAVQICTTGAAS